MKCSPTPRGLINAQRPESTRRQRHPKATREENNTPETGTSREPESHPKTGMKKKPKKKTPKGLKGTPKQG